MEIERLKELRENCEFAIKHEHFIPQQYNTDLLALIDAEIASQPTDCSTCIGCDCEPPLGETVKNCKAYVKRTQPTDDAVRLKKTVSDVTADLEYAEINEQGKVAVDVLCLRKIIDAIERPQKGSDDSFCNYCRTGG